MSISYRCLIIILILVFSAPAAYSQSASGLLPAFRNSGAIDTLRAAEFNEGLILNVPELMTGRVPGLIVSRPGSDPDGFTDLRIRGLSSIESATAPLVVIDHVITNNFDSVDPRDIDQIEVLKDAASSARYGVRGNAGVIRITTKTGAPSSAGDLSVNYHGSVSSSFRANQTDVLNAQQYRSFQSTNLPLPAVDHGFATNWQNEVSQTGISRFHNITVSGGNEATTYRVSGVYRNIETILKGSDGQQLNARANLTHRTLNNKLLVDGSLIFSTRENDFGPAEVFRYAATYNPTAPVRDEEGNFYHLTSFDVYNPVSILEQSDTKKERNQQQLRLSGELNLDFITDGLGAKAIYSQELHGFNSAEYYGKTLPFRSGQDRNGWALRSETKSESEFFEAFITHRIQTGPVSVSTQAGYSSHTFGHSEQLLSGGNFISDAFSYHNLSVAADFNDGVGTVQSSSADHTLLAWFGRSEVSYDDTFFGSFVLRHEGSTRFGENNKWGSFYGISAGAELTKLFDLPHFERVYTRAGYGKTGQDAPFEGISQWRFDKGPYFFNGSIFVPSINAASNPNPDLKWEEKKEINLGADVSFAENRLSVSVDLYRNRVDDLIYEIPVPVPPNQFSRKWVNIGELENRGIEIRLNYLPPIMKQLNWSTILLYAAGRSKLVSLSSDEFNFEETTLGVPGAPGLGSVQLIRLAEGGHIGDIWGPEFAGIDSEGRWQFKSSGSGTVPAEQAYEHNTVIGNGLPDFTLGWNNTFRFSNWDAGVFWQGVFGHDLINIHHLHYANPMVISNYNIAQSAADLRLREYPFFSDYYVEDASYFRLHNMIIGYSFSLPEAAAVKQFRLYASGNNLWTITGYSGVDPEVRLSAFPVPGGSGDSRSVLTPGIERLNMWPTQTTLLFGVQVGF